ncbi:MAG: hypothetical protein ACRDPD_05140 [Streptosporangiaceae bacterium]
MTRMRHSPCRSTLASRCRRQVVAGGTDPETAVSALASGLLSGARRRSGGLALRH